jgi:serine/threonine protein kinase
MGSCNFKASADKDSIRDVNLHHFTKKYAIGRGGFGKVWRVASKALPSEEYAMKEMAKARIITKKSVPSVMSELKLLAVI